MHTELEAARTEAALAPIVAAIVFTAFLDESVRLRERSNELKEEGLAAYEAGVDRRAAWNKLTEAVELGRYADLLREIAAARTRGRRLIGVGAVLFLAGAAVFAAAVIGFMSQIVDGLNGGAVGPPTNPFGPPVFGVPAGLLGWALAAIGVVVTVIGIVQHVVATARRRRVHRSLPL